MTFTPRATKKTLLLHEGWSILCYLLAMQLSIQYSTSYGNVSSRKRLSAFLAHVEPSYPKKTNQTMLLHFFPTSVHHGISLTTFFLVFLFCIFILNFLNWLLLYFLSIVFLSKLNIAIPSFTKKAKKLT